MALAEIVCQNPAYQNGCDSLKLLALKVSLKNVIKTYVLSMIFFSVLRESVFHINFLQVIATIPQTK
jgi:hypothetical protein